MLPNKIKESWIRVNKRIDEFCADNSSKCFKMLFINDVHIGAENANHIHQLEYLKELIKITPVDLIVNGGDIGLDVGEDDAEARRVIELTETATKYDVPYLLIKGNHDFSQNVMSFKQFNEVLNSYFLHNIDPSDGELINNNGDGGDYGFYIDKKTDTRIIFLNTSEEYRKYVFGDKQLMYFINQLENIKEKNLIVLSHYCMDEIGDWVHYPLNESDSTICFKKIMKDFVNHRSGEYKSFKWNFEKVKSKLLIHLSGDAHFNNQSTRNGYLVACRQGYGGVLPEDIPSTGSFDKFNADEECNFDILVINSSNKVKLFHVGAGEIIRDLDIN